MATQVSIRVWSEWSGVSHLDGRGSSPSQLSWWWSLLIRGWLRLSPAGDSYDSASHLLLSARIVSVLDLRGHEQLANPLLVHIVHRLDDLAHLNGGARIQRLENLLENASLILSLNRALEHVKNHFQVELKAQSKKSLLEGVGM